MYSPYYGAVFVSDFLGTDGATVAALDDGSGETAVYVVFSSSGSPLRLLVLNSEYYGGSGTRPSETVQFSGLTKSSGTVSAKRLTAPDATALVNQGAAVTIGGDGTFSASCESQGTQELESVSVSGGSLEVAVAASEALIVYL